MPAAWVHAINHSLCHRWMVVQNALECSLFLSKLSQFTRGRIMFSCFLRVKKLFKFFFQESSSSYNCLLTISRKLIFVLIICSLRVCSPSLEHIRDKRWHESFAIFPRKLDHPHLRYNEKSVYLQNPEKKTVIKILEQFPLNWIPRKMKAIIFPKKWSLYRKDLQNGDMQFLKEMSTRVRN